LAGIGHISQLIQLDFRGSSLGKTEVIHID